MTSVYVAGKFEEKEAVRHAQKRLVELGCTISHDWTGEDSTGKTGEVLEAYLQKSATDDYRGVLSADLILLLNHDRAFGSMVELGLALAWGRTAYIVAPEVRDNIFYHLPAQMGIRTFPTLEEALAAIRDDWLND